MAALFTFEEADEENKLTTRTDEAERNHNTCNENPAGAIFLILPSVTPIWEFCLLKRQIFTAKSPQPVILNVY